MPPLLSQNAPGSALDANGMASAGSDRTSDPQADVASLRQAADPFREFLKSKPALGPLAKEFDALLRKTLVMLASAQPKQTPSSQSLPTGG